MELLKYRINFIFILLLIGANISAQSGFINYQGAARNSNTGNALANKNISLLISLKDGSATGSIIYSEKQNVTTSDLGIFNLRIGEGQAVSGNYQNLNWAGNNRWLQVEMDSEGGSNYNVIGVSELVSVPYALSAKSLANPLNLTQLGDVGNITPIAGQVLQWNGTQWTPATVTGGGGSQSLFLSGDNLSISNGNSVTLPDGSPTNEIQTLSLSGVNLSLSNGGGSVPLPTGTTYTAGNGINISGNSISNAGDLSTTNEIQTMTLAGNNLSLSNGGGTVTLPTGTTYTAGNGINISGNTIENDGDLSNSNELQTITRTGNILSLNNGGGDVDIDLNLPYTKIVNLPSFAFAIENQTGETLKTIGKSDYPLTGIIHSINSGTGPAILASSEGYSIFGIGRMALVNQTNGASSGIDFLNNTYTKSGFVGMNGNDELAIWGYGLGGAIMRFNTNSGTICSNQAITICSDRRLKKDISVLTLCLPKILNLQGFNYRMNNEKITGTQTGFIAQEVQEVFPELVKTDDAGMLSVDYVGMIPHLLESIKTLNELIKKQEQRIQQLEQMVAERRVQNSEFRSQKSEISSQ